MWKSYNNSLSLAIYTLFSASVLPLLFGRSAQTEYFPTPYVSFLVMQNIIFTTECLNTFFCYILYMYIRISSKAVHYSYVHTYIETCSGAKVYRTCGSACPATCDNPSPICTFQCVTGCFCPRGMVEQSDGTCVEPTQCSGKTFKNVCI